MIIARLHPGLATGPLVAALGGLAAATLIAASLTGTGLTSDPWEVPALADDPPASTGPVLVTTPPDIEVSSEVSFIDLDLPVPTLIVQPEEPQRRAGRSRLVTTLTTQERTDPAPQEETLIEYARQRLRDLVDQGTAEVFHDGALRPSNHSQRRRSQGAARPTPGSVPPGLPVSKGSGAPIHAEQVVDAAIATPDPEGVDATVAVTAIEPVQPELSTAAGSSSPLE